MSGAPCCDMKCHNEKHKVKNTQCLQGSRKHWVKLPYGENYFSTQTVRLIILRRDLSQNNFYTMREKLTISTF